MIVSLAQWLERHASYLKDVGLLMFARLLPLDLDFAKHHHDFKHRLTRRLHTSNFATHAVFWITSNLIFY